MTIYSAPLSDIEFALNSFVDLPSIMKYDHFGEADHSMVSDLLAEAGRFMTDIFAPLNKSGDNEGAKRNTDGTVSTPEGFIEAYHAYVEAGWGAVSFDELCEHGTQHGATVDARCN